jgi:hypothetical protein
VISTTPADMDGKTDHGLTGTWFARVGRAPYELMGLIESSSGPRATTPTLPRLELAA